MGKKPISRRNALRGIGAVGGLLGGSAVGAFAATQGGTQEDVSTQVCVNGQYYDERFTFEDGTVNAFDTGSSYLSDNFRVTQASPQAEGSFRAECPIPYGNHWGGQLYYILPNHGYEEPEELYTIHYVFFPGDFVMTDDSHTAKFFDAGANYAQGEGGDGGTMPDGTNGFSNRLYVRGGGSCSTVRPGNYVYHMDQASQWGDEHLWGVEMSCGEWHQVETYTRINSVASDGTANADGVVRSWLDGTQMLDLTGLRFRSETTWAIRQFGPNTYYGGVETSPADNYVAWDDVRFRRGPR